MTVDRITELSKKRMLEFLKDYSITSLKQLELLDKNLIIKMFFNYIFEEHMALQKQIDEMCDTLALEEEEKQRIHNEVYSDKRLHI